MTENSLIQYALTNQKWLKSRLLKKLEEVGNVRLLIIDPIVSAVTGDSHKNAEVRRSLQSLVDLA